MSSLLLLTRIIESILGIKEHLYSEEGITLGIEKFSNLPFKISLSNYKLICIILEEKSRDMILNGILENLKQEEKVFIKWSNKNVYPFKSIENKNILKFQINELSNFFSYYSNLYDFMVYFSELLGDLFNLNYDERLVLKRVLIDRIVPQNRAIITFKDIFRELREAQFRSAYENEYRYLIAKKLEELINDKILEEISIELVKKEKANRDYELNIGLIPNLRLKLLLLNLVLNSLHYRSVAGFRPILFIELPSSIINYLYKATNIQIWDQFYNIIRTSRIVFLITDELQSLPKEIINRIDFTIMNDTGLLNNETTSHINHGKKAKNPGEKEFFVLKKDGKIYELKQIEEEYLSIEVN
ncbi:MAG TPA: hypothetical protein VKU94_01855 [Geobacterales bacterium]|nr:hypothetical protein [Geobacterales bacterium]